MNPKTVFDGEENHYGRLQFLRLVFPTELDQISKRRNLYETEYQGIDPFEVDLKAVEKDRKAG